MKKIVIMALTVIIALSATAQDIPVTGVSGAKLRDIAGTTTLVTIVLKERSAEDPNLQIREIGPNYLSLVNPESGEVQVYLFKDIAEVKVQGSKIEAKAYVRNANVGLSPAHTQLMSRAEEELRKIFNESDANQVLKMEAAMLLTSRNDKNAQQYLKELSMQKDNAITAIEAYIKLYVAGETDINTGFIEASFASGDRRTRAQMAIVSGLYNIKSAAPSLNRMANERATDTSVPAVIALARINDTDSVSVLLDFLTGLNEDKAKAAAKALTIFGGDEIISKLHEKLDQEKGLSRWRIIEILFKLDDPKGIELMKNEAMKIPTLSYNAAILLSKKGDIAAMELLRQRLAERYDIQIEVIRLRARAAAALIVGGDRAMVSELQSLLREDFPDFDPLTRNAYVTQIAKIVGDACLRADVRAFIDILQPSMASGNYGVKLQAAKAILALGDKDLRDRIIIYQESE